MSIPLKARVAIRDLWKVDTSSISKTRVKLQGLLNISIECEPNWPSLIVALDNVYDDKGQLVQSVTATVEVWLNTLASIFEDPSHKPSVEQALKNTRETTSVVTVSIEVSEEDKRATSRLTAPGRFLISLPKEMILYVAPLREVFYGQLIKTFERQQTSDLLPIRPQLSDEWVDASAETAPKAEPQRYMITDVMPDADALPAPKILLTQPPYHLIIRVIRTQIWIECSHSATLDFLEEYLTRWGRTNPQAVPSGCFIRVKLNRSTAFFGTHDVLTLEMGSINTHEYHMSSTLILHLVEKILGYDRVFGEADSWHYRRDRAFGRS